MKKILWVSNFAPYVSREHAGGKTFSFYFDKIYNDENYKLSLVCCLWQKDKEKLNKNIETLNQKLGKIEKIKLIYPIFSGKGYFKYKIKRLVNIESKFNIFTRYCNLISNYSVIEIIKTLKQYKKENYSPNFIILEWTPIVLLAKKIKKIFPNAKLIASEHDVTFIGFERKYQYFTGPKKLLWKIRYNKLKKNEINSLKLCDYSLVHNKNNSNVLEQNAIIPEKIQWLVPYFDNMLNLKRIPQKNNIIFYGAMNGQENYLSAIWFIENVMPLIKDLNLKFIIVGANPAEELLKYKSESVEITGFVESIEPYFSKAMCFVSPLVIGAGIKVKILEALSSGIPILTNDIGIDGIDAINGKHFYYCKTAEDYEQRIRDIYSDKNILNEMEVKSFLKENFNVDSSLENYKNILNN